MMNVIQHWTQRHPYTLTGLLFLAMVLLGWTALGWGERQLGFLLLIYFIVTLGIRLDEISRTLGSSSNLRAAVRRPGDPHGPVAGDPVLCWARSRPRLKACRATARSARIRRGFIDPV